MVKASNPELQATFIMVLTFKSSCHSRNLMGILPSLHIPLPSMRNSSLGFLPLHHPGGRMRPCTDDTKLTLMHVG